MRTEKVISQIRKDRRELGMTQSELARRARVHLNTVNNLEQGKHVPGLALTLRILSVLEQAKRRKVQVLSLKNQFQLERPARAS